MSDSTRADLLYSRMVESPPSKMFSQDDLKVLVNESDLAKLLGLAQSLIDRRMVKLVKVGDDLRFQAISQTDTRKLTSMSDDEQMVYTYIEASGREGIWTKTLKAKTNMHQHIIMRCLKSLESQRHIKSVKSVKHPTRKIYMLYHLQPSIDVTGGPWFTDSELDTDFIDSLLTVVWRFIASKTYPTAFQESSANTSIFSSVYPASHTGFATLDSTMEFIVSHKITNTDLATSDIRALCEVLIHDDKIEVLSGAFDVYRATWQSVLEAGYGRQYLETGSLSEIQESFVADLYEKHQFSLFDHHSVINDEINGGDASYLDAWARQ